MPVTEIVEGTFTDPRDSKVYKTVKIGEQVWMAENLNFDCPEAKCYNDPKDTEKYGRLYDWETAKKACPEGWHLPNKKEWEFLMDSAGGKGIAGKKLKTENGNGTDNYAFSALMGGYVGFGGFSNVGYVGLWWSANENNSDGAHFRYMLYNDEGIYWNCNYKTHFYSVRCVQGPEIPEPEIDEDKRELYEKIRRKYGKHGSWAIWPLEDLYDYEKIKGKIKPNIVMTGHELYGKIKEDFKNFHFPGYEDETTNDGKLKSAFENTEFEGAYMTDIIKFGMKEDVSIEFFKEELKTIGFIGSKNPLIIALGQKAFDMLERNGFSRMSKLIWINWPNFPKDSYSHLITYREKVLEMIKGQLSKND